VRMRTVRDVIGEPEQWSNCFSDEPEPMPYVNGARILDVFGNARALAIHLRGEAGSETLSVFEITDAGVREGLIKALKPGAKIREVLDAPI
jgi:hypothetical protein